VKKNTKIVPKTKTILEKRLLDSEGSKLTLLTRGSILKLLNIIADFSKKFSFKAISVYVFLSFICLLTSPIHALTISASNGPSHLSSQLIEELVDVFEVESMIETGTFQGVSTKYFAKYFDEVHSVELGQDLFDKAKTTLKPYPNIFLYQGNTVDRLSEMMDHCSGRIGFFLDAHYSGGITARGPSDQPIADELRVIFSKGHNDCVITMDDIRDFNLVNLNNTIKDLNPNFSFFVLGDIGIAFDQSIYPIEIVESVKAATTQLTSRSLKEIIQADLLLASTANPKDTLQLANQFGRHYTFWHGLVLFNQGKYQESISYFKKSLELAKNPILSKRFQYPWRIYAYLATAASKTSNLKLHKASMEKLKCYSRKYTNEIDSILKL